MQKTNDRYHNGGEKEKAAKYYLENEEVLKKARNRYRNLSGKEKEAKRDYGKNRYRNMKEKTS